VSPSAIIGEIVLRVVRISVLIVIGVYLANVAIDRGIIDAIARGSRWLTRPAHLPDEVGTAIVTTAASTTAGYGMLAEFRTQGRLSDTETVIAVIMNTFFGFVQHIFTFYAPVLIPILGLQVGLLYVSFRAAIALAITVCGVALGALLLQPPEATGGETTPAAGPGPRGTAQQRTRRTVRRIIPRPSGRSGRHLSPRWSYPPPRWGSSRSSPWIRPRAQRRSPRSSDLCSPRGPRWPPC
jgi:hypothetical protein